MPANPLFSTIYVLPAVALDGMEDGGIPLFSNAVPVVGASGSPAGAASVRPTITVNPVTDNPAPRKGSKVTT